MTTPQLPGIADEQLAASAPLVRALLVARLEQIWAACEPYIIGVDINDGTRLRPDPRFVEAGLRCLDRLAQVYRLGTPVAATAGELVGPRDPAGVVLAGLAELEARLAAQGQPEGSGGR